MRIRTRLAPLLLVVVGLALTGYFGRDPLGDGGTATGPGWVFLLPTLLAIAMLALAAAVSIEPEKQQLRIALAGIALAWFAILVGLFATSDPVPGSRMPRSSCCCSWSPTPGRSSASP